MRPRIWRTIYVSALHRSLTAPLTRGQDKGPNRGLFVILKILGGMWPLRILYLVASSTPAEVTTKIP